MSKHCFWACMGVVLVSTIESSFGGLVVTNQVRSISVNATTGAPPTTLINQSAVAAPDVPFNQTVSGSTTIGSMAASQNSSFGVVANQFVVNAAGQASVTFTSSNPSDSAKSTFDLSFTLDAPTPYSANALLGFSGAGDLDFSEVFLKQGATVVFDTVLQAGGPNKGANPLNVSGVLQPGTYELYGHTEAGFAGVETDNSQFQLSFAAGTAVPLPSAWRTGLLLIIPVGFFCIAGQGNSNGSGKFKRGNSNGEIQTGKFKRGNSNGAGTFVRNKGR